MTSTQKTMKFRKGRIGFLLFVIAALGLLCVIPRSSLKTTLSEIVSSVSSSVVIAEDSQTTLGNVMKNDTSNKQRLRRSPSSSGKQPKPSHLKETQRRRLAGYEDIVNDPAALGSILFILILFFLLCCCRGCLCDLLACVCLYEMCCDDGVVGGFDLMPF